ncbi:type I-E CRISPR-associated protein Cas6/Cse3/CasE [Salinibacter grassmerensis]|uniref:type I-E CRISPR-associated protein Cas6/Cse3/CasE n=1 Tax=Salinibacter grassmerensis TaxID=3040353 RepID=UPI0021E99853|nr:type I-E CRISPR-associated protein Cas6/Cse3/CasE [Salinibacter grassmerensis]
MYLTDVRLDAHTLAKLIRDHRLPIATADTGYRLHVGLTEVFGDDAPKPFWLRQDDGDMLTVFGYTGKPAEDLRAAAQLHASPLAFDALVDIRSKPMPEISEGTALEMHTRACPQVQKASSGTGTNADGERVSWREGQVMDAYLSEVYQREDTGIGREEVYVPWLARQFDIRGGARVQSGEDNLLASLQSFDLKQVRRRDHTSGSSALQRLTVPVAEISAQIEITDQDKWTSLVSSGIGKQKSFGFGMILVRPA